MLLRHLSAQDAGPRKRPPTLPKTTAARPAYLPGNGYGRVQSPAYIRWKCQNYAEILKRHDGNETFSRFWSRVHELFERQTGLSVYEKM